MAADSRRAGGPRRVQPGEGARTARPVPRAAGRHGAARRTRPDGLSVLLAGQVAAHGADRLPLRRRHRTRGRHAGARHRHHLGCRHPHLGRQSDRRSARLRSAPVALDRLQSTTIATSIRETTGRRLHRFSWINEWKERADAQGAPLGLELILPDWFFAGVLDEALVLTIDPAYFKLTGGIERWLYRLVRKHGGKQRDGWQFDFPYLYRKSGSLAQPRDFARDLVLRPYQPLFFQRGASQ